jgi:predicted acetyltransferase
MRYNTEMSVYELDDLPGCKQVGVSNGMFILPQYRGMGFADTEHKSRLDHMKMLGYDYALCTVNSANMQELQILNKNGWKLLSGFVSKNTGHHVYIYGRQLDNPTINPGD